MSYIEKQAADELALVRGIEQKILDTWEAAEQSRLVKEIFFNSEEADFLKSRIETLKLTPQDITRFEEKFYNLTQSEQVKRSLYSVRRFMKNNTSDFLTRIVSYISGS